MSWAGTGAPATASTVINSWQGAKLVLVTRAVAEPVSLVDIKAHLRVISTDDDDYIGALISAARAYVESAQGRQLCSAEWQLTLPAFRSRYIPLDPSPLRSITHIKYYDDSNVLQTLDSDLYETCKYYANAGVGPVYDADWPSVYNRSDAVQITFYAGYGDAADVPHTTTHAIKMLVAYWYGQREAVTDRAMSEAPLAVQTLINMDCVRW